MAKITVTEETENVAVAVAYQIGSENEAIQLLAGVVKFLGGQVQHEQPARTDAPEGVPQAVLGDQDPTAVVAPLPKQRRKRRSKAEIEAAKAELDAGLKGNGADVADPATQSGAPSIEDIKDLVRTAVGQGHMSGDQLADFLTERKTPRVIDLDAAGRTALAAKIMETPSDAG